VTPRNRKVSEGQRVERAQPADGRIGTDDSPPPPLATSTSVRPPRQSVVTDAESPSRARRATRLARVAGGAAIVIAASTGVAWGAKHYVTTSPRFGVRHVLVEGNARRSAEQVATAGGVAVGKNIFALDVGRVASAIQADPWIESAKVTRELPSTIRIRIAERDARAAAAIGGELYLVTRDGDPFKKLEGDDPGDLPVVTGIEPAAVARDRAGVVNSLRRMLDVVDDLDGAGILKRYPLEELHAEKDGALVVTIGREAISLQLGQPPYRGKVEQAARVLGEVSRRKASPSVIFLDNEAHPERVVVRMK